jgi:four helix bundle protein
MRFSEELRGRTKRYASGIVRSYASLPLSRKEVQIIAHQLLRSGTSVATHAREASRARSDAEFSSKLEGALQEADESELCIWNCSATTAELSQGRLKIYWRKRTS